MKIDKAIWLYGLSGAGKSTIAKELNNILIENKIPHVLLDGDDLRSGINKDLGFSNKDRNENIRRAAELADLLMRQNVISICSFITPFYALRKMVKEILKEKVVLVFINTPIEVCTQRDVKGLYAKAKTNVIKEFTGISSQFEDISNGDIVISTTNKSPRQCAEDILSKILR